MHLLELNGTSAADDLAIDEALLEQAERGDSPLEVLRLWEPPRPMVVIGRSSQAAREVNLAECRRRGIPVLRRTSGGAAIITGPGCLMYALVLSYTVRPTLRAIDAAHRHVLGTLAEALRPLAPGIALQGTSDLAIDRRKVSGNSVRCRREHLLYHGTLLYDFPLELIGACLLMPPRQPNYRADREHLAFVMNLPTTSNELRAALRTAWQADEPLTSWPSHLAGQLAAEKYTDDTWTFSR